MGLGEARYRKLGTYSLGMKQMAKLAQAIAHGPRLLLLDEPTNGLDPPARQRMIQLIREIRDAGRAPADLVAPAARRGGVLRRGADPEGRALAAHCNLDEERRANRKFLELETVGASAVVRRGASSAWAASAPSSQRPGLARVKLVLPEAIVDARAVPPAAEHDVQIRRLNYRRDSLEDIFLAAMKENGGARWRSISAPTGRTTGR